MLLRTFRVSFIPIVLPFFLLFPAPALFFPILPGTVIVMSPRVKRVCCVKQTEGPGSSALRVNCTSLTVSACYEPACHSSSSAFKALLVPPHDGLLASSAFKVSQKEKRRPNLSKNRCSTYSTVGYVCVSPPAVHSFRLSDIRMSVPAHK